MTLNGTFFNVQVELTFDVLTGQLSAVFDSIDPETLLPPDVLTGFLPPEDGTGIGHGFVNFTIQPRHNLPTGTELRNIAIIRFDGQNSIATNQIDPQNPAAGTSPLLEALNTIDAEAPVSQVGILPANSPAIFTVNWSGADGSGSGVASYDVYVSINGGVPALWLNGVSMTQAVYTGQPGSTYAFYSVARDNVGQAEAPPLAPDAVTRINQAPTNVAISATSVQENLPADTFVGTLSAEDPDLGNTFTFVLVSGDGSADNSSFNVVGNELRTAVIFDLETKPNYLIRLRVTDQGGLSFEKQFTINVTDVNEAPTDTSLSIATISENLSIGTTVGMFSTDDPDASSTFVYSLVSVQGSSDHASFTIDGNTLKTAAILDFETKSTYSLQVRATDAGELFFDKVILIEVLDRLDGTIGVDVLELRFTANNVSVARSTDSGPMVSLGTFSLTSPLEIQALQSTDTVRMFGTSGNDMFHISGSGLFVNNAQVVLGGPAELHFVGEAGNDTYQFGADTQLGSVQIMESGSGVDTIDFSPTLAADVRLNLSSVVTQIVNANLSLRLNSGTVIENLVGGAGNDILTGNSLANILTGNAGNDLLVGGSGDDMYVFGLASVAEADQVTENVNEGIDTLNFSAVTTNVWLHIGANSLQTVHTNRTLKLNSPITFENSIGGAGADTLIGNTLDNTLIGGAGNDTLNGALGSDVLFGGADNDTYLFGPASAAEADQVTENVNEGTDTLNFAFLTTNVWLHLGANSIQTVHSNRTLKLNSPITFENSTGGSGADTLIGNTLDNTLIGRAGDDTLNGALGSDLLFGGANSDTYLFGPASAAEADQVIENLNEGNDTLNFAYLTTSIVLNLGANSIQTVHTNRTLKLNSPITFENSTGGSGADTLIGNTLDNTLIGRAGDDTLNGALGSDLLFGGANSDTYLFGPASAAEADQVIENLNEGNDTLNFAYLTTSIVLNLGANSIQTVHTNRTLKLNSPITFEYLIGGAGADTLTGNSLNNILNGGAGDDRLIGAAGDDIMRGGADNDTYFFGPATVAEADQVIENADGGIDTLNFAYLTTDVVLNLGSTAIQTVHLNRTLKLNSVSTFENAMGGTGSDTLLGNALANRLTGGTGDDILVGLEDRDILEAGSGRDILIGGLGLDILNGGDGEDILIAGRTTSDSSLPGLNTLRTAWVSTDTYEGRIASLRTGFGSPEVSLQSTINVLNDGGEDDVLLGGDDSDWFFRALDDVIIDLFAGEILDTL